MQKQSVSGKASAMKMAELIVLFKPLFIGFLLAEVWSIAFNIGSLYAPNLARLDPGVRLSGIALGFSLCSYYFYRREGHKTSIRIIKSFRIDLLATFGMGIWAHTQAYPVFERIHLQLFAIISGWTQFILFMLFVVILSPFLHHRSAKKHTVQSNYFLSDIEINSESGDLLNIKEQAKKFAESVMQSADVFGVDGPWGIGKTSFINLAERVWSNNSNFLVCRFEPLRYASEPDLAGRLVRELTSTIQKSVYAPEFLLAADKYSRLIKGKAEVSFLGFKLSLEPSPETVDDLLDDIDEVLKRINRRVIIVIDDLDRLDAKTVNNILFATKRTLKLTQATYVLCYDTEILTKGQGKDESSLAREFLEKFVTIKYSLFVDNSSICDFLRGKWKDSVLQDGTTPPDAIMQLSSIFDELANILQSDIASHYLPLVGNMRKVKRFINTIRLMQIEKTNLIRTDFNKRDLINLILLHLNYPGLFRQIYAEETGGNKGSFSIKYDSKDKKYINADNFEEIVETHSQDTSSIFLAKQLFDVETIEWEGFGGPNEGDFASRACFNNPNFRNLEAYLNLIVRVIAPEPETTLILYKEALENIRNGTTIVSILKRTEFTSHNWEYAHERLWTEILNQSYSLPPLIVEQAIDTLIIYLPDYPSVKSDDRALRELMIYILLELLDRAGWGASSKRRDPESVIDIAKRMFGEDKYNGRNLLNQLTESKRGVIGWFDLLLFRLKCSADRQGQLHNLLTALLKHQDPNSQTTGSVSTLAINEMRLLSQKIFSQFKNTYITPKRNFIADVDMTHDEAFIGKIKRSKLSDHWQQVQTDLTKQITHKRFIVKSFVVYQLSNTLPPTGSGVGCGYYDEDGKADNKGIAKAMNDYLFNICFNPKVNERNAFYFFEHCLSHLTTPFHTGDLEGGLIASKESLTGGLDPIAMGIFWLEHSEIIRQQIRNAPNREVITSNYSVEYGEVVEKVFSTLDDIAKDARSQAAFENGLLHVPHQQRQTQ